MNIFKNNVRPEIEQVALSLQRHPEQWETEKVENNSHYLYDSKEYSVFHPECNIVLKLYPGLFRTYRFWGSFYYKDDYITLNWLEKRTIRKALKSIIIKLKKEVKQEKIKDKIEHQEYLKELRKRDDNRLMKLSSCLLDKD